MNIENIMKVIDAIRGGQGKDFMMRYYESDCGTAFCIAGHVNMIRRKENGGTYMISYSADGDWLGIDYMHTDKLFFMSNGHSKALTEFDKIEPQIRACIAITVLENLIETGQVDWPAAALKHGESDFAERYTKGR